MPIKIPSGLPAIDVLEREGVSVLSHEVSLRQDVRALQIALVNLMPNKEVTETQFARLIGATPLNVELTLIRMATHKTKNASPSHMEAFYITFAEARHKKYDGLIITGAPVEKMAFEEVTYWEELQQIFDWSQTHVHWTMAVCWGAQAMLHHFHGVPKHALNKKAFGLACYSNLAPGSPFLRGFSDEFCMPVSRWTESRADDLPKDAGLCVLCSSAAAGLCLVEDPRHRALYMFNHVEYDTTSLQDEYRRDVGKGSEIQVPFNYFPQDDPSQAPRNRWRGHAHLLFSNWISQIFLTQTTLAVPAHTTNRNWTAAASDYDSDRIEGEKFDTIMVHHGQAPNVDNRACAPPIYAASSFAFESTDHGAALFSFKKFGPIYSRIMNPTTHVLEYRIAKLEGSLCPAEGTQPSALVTASGQAAQMHTFLTICQSGDHIIAGSELYGGTYAQLKHTLPSLGIEVSFFDVTKPYVLEAYITESTKVIFLETIANPSYSIPDFERISEIAAKHSIPLVVDNTFGMCGYACRPLKFGAHIVVESCTKWIGGHGNTIGGVIIDGCNFNWGVRLPDGSPKFPRLNSPCAAYHGINFWEEFGPAGPLKANMAFIFHARLIAMRDMGACQNPFGSFMLLTGLETLSIRCRAECENANKLAAKLAADHRVDWVSHPSLVQHPSHKMAVKYFRSGTFGAVLSFGIKGGFRAAKDFIDSVRLSKHVANVGDAKTLVIHPASTTHGQLSVKEALAGGVTPDMIRVSVGLEDIGDILADFDQALTIASKRQRQPDGNNGSDGARRTERRVALRPSPGKISVTPADVWILDGGMGHQLRAMGIEIEGPVGSMRRFLGVAMANIDNPALVRAAHLAFIDAGAGVITTNSYACVPKCLTHTTRELDVAEGGLQRIVAAAGRIARAACDLRPNRRVRVAGCLPPLAESYRPDLVGEYEENLKSYRTIAQSIAPFSDVLLCETMSTAEEGRAACSAACETGLPVWVSWTLDECKPVLRSGESIHEAIQALEKSGGGTFPASVEACLFNCTSAEITSVAVPLLRELLPSHVQVGAYANGFVTATEGTGEYRDLTSNAYYDKFVQRWLCKGATIVGGCCGIFPEHIAHIRERLEGLDQHVAISEQVAQSSEQLLPTFTARRRQSGVCLCSGVCMCSMETPTS